MSYFKGFSILNSFNDKESAEIINGFIKKLLKEKGNECYYKNTVNIVETIEYNKSTQDNEIIKPAVNYVNVIKTEKKSNITRENIHIIMLMQVPDVSVQSATAIINKYKTIKNLVIELEINEKCLDFLKLESSNRKISKKVVENIKTYLLN